MFKFLIMTARLFLSVTILVLISACNQKPVLDSPEEVKKVLIDYFEGIENNDYQKMIEVTTDNFLLFENGLVWNNDSIINFIKSQPNMKVDFSFDGFIINMGNSIANMSYLNHGSFVINDTINQDMYWIESASFTKKDKVWKMDFLHSTHRK